MQGAGGVLTIPYVLTFAVDQIGRFQAVSTILAAWEWTPPEWFFSVVDILAILGAALLCLAVAVNRVSVLNSLKDWELEITALHTAICLTVLAAAGWSYFFLDKYKGPIQWVISDASPLSWQRPIDGSLLIIGFQVSATNRWSEVVIPKRAYIRSEMNGRTIDLNAKTDKGDLPVDKVAIPGNTNFTLYKVFPGTDEYLAGQMPVSKFQELFSKFSLIFEYEGGKYETLFSESEVKKLLDLAMKKSSPQALKPTGAITRD